MKYCVPLILFILLLFFLPSSTYAQEICDNGIDDDGNGLIDCADRDNCQFNSACLNKEICNNGKDDDGDGFIDCFDGDCGNSTSCEVEADCGNGIDDDGDGFYDSYDGDCLVHPDNPNEYIILRPDCEAKPVREKFNLEEAWTSPVGTSTPYGLPIVADIDNDPEGFPEVVVLNGHTNPKKITVLDGRDGTIKAQKSLPWDPSLYPLTADVDEDGKGEIFIMSRDGRIIAYEDDLSEISAWGGQKSSTHNFERKMGVADFNEDGTAELYYVNEIRNATTGDLLIKGSHGSTTMYKYNDWNTQLNGVSVAVDVLDDDECTDCAGLELVVGHIIYSVDIAGGKLTEVRDMNDVTDTQCTNCSALGVTWGSGFGTNYYPKKTQFGGGRATASTTSVVDYDTDGSFDVIMGGAVDNGNGDPTANGPTTIFYWNVKKNEVKAFIATRPGAGIDPDVIGNFRDIFGGKCNSGEDCTWMRGVGAINVANIDADPELECTFMTGLSLYALDNELDLEWNNHNSFWEVSSGFTGTSVFDFDGDGQSEIIYRDEIDLYIIKGEDGSIRNQVSGSPCSSQTQNEYPIVADVDGDGETEIIVTCGDVPNTFGQYPATDSRRDKGVVRVYKSKDSFWVPARKLWNQFSYFNVNIDDDLGVPQFTQPHNVNFAQVCANSNGPKFSLNKFLNQSPRITNCGDLAFPAAQLDLNKDSISVVPPSCPAEQLTVNLYLENNGDYPVTKPIPVAFYAKNPTTYEGTEDIFLDTVYVDVPGGLQSDSSYWTTFTIDAKVGASNIYVSLNDIGPFDKKTKARIPPGDFYKLDSLNGTVNECDATPTVVATLVAPEGFPVNIKKLNDNRSCLSTIKNGELQALDKDSLQFDPLGEYTFTWTNIRTKEKISTGSSDILTNLDSGEYQVEVQYNNGSFTCVGGTDTATIELIEAFPPNLRVSVKEISAVSSCKEGTADGIAQVYIRDLNNLSATATDSIPNGGYTIKFVIEENSGVEQVVQAQNGRAENLKTENYNVYVTDDATGCTTGAIPLDMSLSRPELDDPDVEPVTFCDNPNGKITINLKASSVDPKAIYKYMLINTASSPSDTLEQDSPVFEDLSPGIYRIGAYNIENKCGLFDSERYKEVNVEDKTVEPDVTLSVAQEQTACEAPFTGQLTATPAAGSPSYEYTWYQGTDTNPSTGIIVAQTATTPDTLGTSITDTYTLVAKDPITGCITSKTIRLIENITRPVLDPANIKVKPLTQCGSTNGQITVTMGNATDGYTTDGYTFRLYEGTNTTGSFVDKSDGIFTGLDSIKYTLVVKDEKTRCLTDDTQGYVVKVPSAIVYPETVLVLNPVDQNSCDSNNPNGSIAASIAGGNVSDYTFRWFKNVNGVKAKLISAEPQAIYNSDSSEVRGLTTGSYILEITTDSTGCASSKTIFLEDDVVSGDDIQVNLVSVDATSCDNPNGSLTVDKVRITSDGGMTFTDDDITQYDFRWYEGTDTTSRIDENTNPSATMPSLNNVLPGNYTVVATNRTSTCLSSFYTGTVDGPPALDFDFQAQQQGSTGSLDPCTNPDGGLSVVNLSGGSGNYSYQWYQGSDTSVPIPGATTPSLSSIRSDKYTVEITDLSTGCATDSTFLLESIPGLTPVPPAVLTTTSPATTCDPDNYDGELVAEVDPSVKSVSYPSHTNNDFFYYWFEGDQVRYKSPLLNPGNLDDPANYDTFRNPPVPNDNKAALTQLPPGEYTVVIIDAKDYIAGGANDISLLGCRSAPRTFEVEEIAQKPEQISINVTNNTACAANGSISLTVGKKGTDNTDYSGHTFLWSKDGVAVPVSQVATNDNSTTEESTSTASNLEGGQYTVLIRDGKTTCDTTIFVQVINDYVIEEIATVTPTHASVCAGTGSLEVTAMSNSAPISDYTFIWFNNSFDETKAANDQAAGVAIANTNANTAILSNQPVGTYWVAAMHNVTQCYSIAVQQTIKDQAPVIEILPLDEKVNFVSCTGVDEGLLDINVQSSDGVARNYNYSWTDLAGNAIPVANGGNTDRITGLKNGQYIVTVTEANGDLCQVIDTFAVDLINKRPILDASGTDITICASGGSISIDEVRLNGNPESDLTRYDYIWYQGSFDVAGKTAFEDAVAAGDYTYDPTTLTYSGLAEGVYYLQATANFPDGCTSQQVQVTIEDEVPVFDIVNTFISKPITACDPSLYTGEIEFRIDGLANPNIQWYEGDDTSTPIDVATNASAKDLLLKDVPPGTYTVQVTDNDNTQCPQTRTYTLLANPVPLSVNLSANPQTSCIEGNGAVSAVPNGGARGVNYQYTWYQGDGTTVITDADYPSLASNPTLLEGVPAGEYIVEVTTTGTDICNPARDTITVEDRSGNDLQITVNPDYPVSNCDETNPNGQLSAQFEGSLSRYAFYWYEGTDITANPVAEGATAFGLAENTYSVVALDRITGCLSDPFTGDVVTMLDTTLFPAPTVEIISPVTRCLDPNGAARATLDSTMLDPNVAYEYIWYDSEGQEIFASRLTNEIYQLDTGLYTVLAKNLSTGCLTEPASVVIGENIDVPDFEIVTTPSVCEQATGSVAIQLNEPVKIVKVEWETPIGYNEGMFLTNQPAGEYEATITDENGCQTTQSAVILPDIEVFNAVSSNGDGKNDIFHINCIGAFENNIVRIYNRAGSLVYEHVGYDNERIFFEGYGNKGLYFGAKELPDGTYFYIVDKRNGDDPVSGYLELLR